jgi:hypothetical protein
MQGNEVTYMASCRIIIKFVGSLIYSAPMSIASSKYFSNDIEMLAGWSYATSSERQAVGGTYQDKQIRSQGPWCWQLNVNCSKTNHVTYDVHICHLYEHDATSVSMRLPYVTWDDAEPELR